MRDYYVYILSNYSGTLYVGVTNDLERRVAQHKAKLRDGFTKKYNVTTLVYYGHTNDVTCAIEREKEIKAWRRSKKLDLIHCMNPGWEDLSAGWNLPEMNDVVSMELNSRLKGEIPRGVYPDQSRRARNDR
jgi:putative endonuclease